IFWTRRRLVLAVSGLLTIHLALAISSLLQENPTVDEVLHLPAGVSYWQTGRFSMYRHNPPLFKLVAAVPVLFSGVVTEPLYNSPYWRTNPPNKTAFGHEFARLNAQDYFELFARSRILMPFFSVLGGLAIFCWSRSLYGPSGGLLSLALWCLCPNILAHARLITSDVPASALGAAATYLFVRYLHDPSWKRATWAGLMLGVVQVTKFSGLLLFAVWPLIALAFLFLVWDRAFWRVSLGRLVIHGLGMLLLCLLVINITYRFDGFGRPLGQYRLLSHMLARDVPASPAPPPPNADLGDLVARVRVNRFRGTVLESLPVPLPADYVLGFDDQKLEAEGVPARALDPNASSESIRGYPVYLDGTLRDRSWWYYYLLALVYKVPEGTWILAILALATLVLTRRSRTAWADEFGVWVVPAIVILVMSLFTNINLGLRYVLPAFPFVYVGCGRLAAWSASLTGRTRPVAIGLIGLSLAQSVVSALWVHPHYLAYFNAVSGGPDHGSEHLIDSNLDWGQDLVNLKRWVDRNAPGERLGLAYFGQVPPVIFQAR
ncbi:MAG TPA: glycosyltransferase family 39 protein, partial [Isosphaeraceae bacterium]|nr:glycosyltransferase family 39 protein [Isosphaeraceae bacterium]